MIAPHLIFAVTCAVWCIRYGLKPVYFSNFELFLSNPKLIFPFVLDTVLNYWVSFSLFRDGFFNQYLLQLLNYIYIYIYIYILKTRVIKLLIIYLIFREGVVQCSSLHHAEQCTVTYSAMRLYHFVGCFGVVFAVCWTPLFYTIYF